MGELEDFARRGMNAQAAICSLERELERRLWPRDLTLLELLVLTVAVLELRGHNTPRALGGALERVLDDLNAELERRGAQGEA